MKIGVSATGNGLDAQVDSRFGRCPNFVIVELEGKQIKITIKDGKVYLNDTVQVIITDTETTNGVIHVIDTVLLPE